ncbi:MAG: RIP metalloprotease RseP [Lachnospiraceae bacterium]|nr:RIP metalloprotease RseP [Lachnospiraceae bacterium]
MSIISILLFFVIFSLVVVVHEFGHYLLARKNGIKVESFDIGMGPELIGIQGKHTRFTIKLIPFGGACIMKGNDMGLPDTEEAKEQAQTTAAAEDSFASKSVWARIAVLFAGPFFNFLLAFFVFLIIVSQSGVDKPIIMDVLEGYPAQEAGLQSGDEIVKLNGSSVHFYRDITLNNNLNPGKELTLVYKRDGVRYTTTIQPKWSEEDNGYLIGVYGGQYYEAKGLEVLVYGFREVEFTVKVVVKSLGQMITSGFSLNNFSGPVGIATTVDTLVDDVQEVTQDESNYTKFMTMFLTMANFLGMISANLGVMNLLPIPGLDGGRLLFCFIEAVRGKPVAKEKEAIVTFVGFVLLMILMVAVLFNDIKNVL